MGALWPTLAEQGNFICQNVHIVSLQLLLRNKLCMVWFQTYLVCIRTISQTYHVMGALWPKLTEKRDFVCRISTVSACRQDWGKTIFPIVVKVVRNLHHGNTLDELKYGYIMCRIGGAVGLLIAEICTTQLGARWGEDGSSHCLETCMKDVRM